MTEKQFLTVAGYASDEFIERKSRFIGHIAPAASEAEAAAFVEKIRQQHKMATHNCYAWVCGENDQSQRSSDMGEPAGTAGRPILEAIKRAELHNTVIVVTRYFGGILLGAGGLTRAYAHAALIAIHAAVCVRKIPAQRFAFSFDYSLIGKVEGALQQAGCCIDERLFTQQVCMLCRVEKAALADLLKKLDDLSGGAVCCQDLGEEVWIER